MIEISPGVELADSELSFVVSRSGGPGGQHVNKVNSRVILRFDLDHSPSLDAGQKRRIRQRLRTRITRDGIVWIVCGRNRSQAANRREALERFVELLRGALRRRRPRHKTVTPAAAKRRRLEQKRRRSRLKTVRGRVCAED